ncbi:MAG: hypothetical protein J6V19_01670 [Alistipes sp.]|nr:hypothetical protein [Alistipes sp.]
MKRLVLLMASLFVCATLFAQAKKPTIMVVPSDNWCVQNGYVQKFDNMGTEMILPDYRAALQQSSDLLLAISKINEMMAEREFPLKNLESSLKTLMNQEAEDAMLTNKEGGGVAESPIDKLKKVAKADIWMQLTYTVNQVGPKRSLTFNLQGLDAYTDKQIAGASGTSEPSFTSELAILIEEAVLMHIDNFNAQLQSHFDDIFANGREIVVRIKTWDDAGFDLEEEFDGDELGMIIEDWMSDNTKHGRFNTTDATENMMLFEQVRIPVEMEEDGKVRQVDARRWVNGLRKYLKSEYDIESKLMMQGLGQAQLVIGAK